MHLTRDQFAQWLGRYIEAWRSGDHDAIGDLFSHDASYSYRPGVTVVNGRDAIVASWLDEPDDPDRWAAHYEPLAIDEEVHVAIGWSRYFEADGAIGDEYSNIFVCRFDDEGRCSELGEWWMRVTDPGSR